MTDRSNKDRFRNPHKRANHIHNEHSSEDSENIFPENLGDNESDSDYTENIEFGMKKSKDQYPQLLVSSNESLNLIFTVAVEHFTVDESTNDGTNQPYESHDDHRNPSIAPSSGHDANDGA